MSYLNSTDNLSFFSMTENNIEVSSYFSSIGDYSENKPNLSEILEFQDMIQNSDEIQRIDNVMNKFKITKKRGRGRNKESKKLNILLRVLITSKGKYKHIF